MSSPGTKVVKITRVERYTLHHPVPVYNIAVSESETYFANSCLVHNCSLGCTYCFAYAFKSNNPCATMDLKSIDPVRTINALEGHGKTPTERALYKHFYSRKFLLHWGGMADPFCAFEKTNKAGLPVMEWLAENNYPTLFSFKGPTIFQPEYKRLFTEASKQQNFAFQISMVTGDDNLARLVEVGVPSPSKRIEAIKMLSDLGYWTILRLRPFIIGISEKGLDRLLDQCLEAGIRGISTEFMAIDGRCNSGMRTRYNWLAKIIGTKDLHKYFKALSPQERGGYMRLNRLVKEPYVRQLYEFCTKHGLVFGCSDPDFKELNTSGSCCAMPDKFPDNPLLENWTHSQLTYALKSARIRYHKTGKTQYLRFSEVYDGEKYINDKALANDHISVIGRCWAERKALTHRDVLLEQWNNLDSPGCPRNYLHGKVMPTGELDEEGCFIFKYVESDYETRWRAEGVDLTK